MVPDEWCAIAHVDVGPRARETAEQLLTELATDLGREDGVVAVAILQQLARANHFEIVARFSSEAAYDGHLGGPANHSFRAGIEPLLASPYDDRLHRSCAEQTWPSASTDDVIVIAQIELRPRNSAAGLAAIEELASAQSTAAGRAQTLLPRRARPARLELISIWSSLQDFGAGGASPRVAGARSVIADFLVAPIEDRAHHLLAGTWSGQ